MSTQSFTTFDADPTLTNPLSLSPNSATVVNSVLRTPDLSSILSDPTKLLNIAWQPGQSLDKLATNYLGNCFGWQTIAQLNNLDPTKQILNGTLLKVPTQQALINAVKTIVVNSPEVQKTITSIKGSILDLSGVGTSNTTFANNLKDCVNKLIDFKPAKSQPNSTGTLQS